MLLWSPRAQLCAWWVGFFRNFPSSSQSLGFLLSRAIRNNVILILEHSWELALLYLWQSLTILYLRQKPTNVPWQSNPSRRSRKIYMCSIHYYNWDCFCFVLFFPAPTPIPSKWAEYILFASLLLAVCILFAIMARFYTYINPAEIEAQFDEEDKKKKPENLYPEIDPASPTAQTKMWMSGSQWRVNWAPSTLWLVSPGGKTLRGRYQHHEPSQESDFLSSPSWTWNSERSLFFFFKEKYYLKYACMHIHIFTALWAFPAFNFFPVTQMKLFFQLNCWKKWPSSIWFEF